VAVSGTAREGARAGEAAADLLAQLKTALQAGWTAAELSQALGTVGLEVATARSLVAHVERGHAIEVEEDDEVMLHLSGLCAAVRDPRDSLRIPEERVAQLADALAVQGVERSLATAVAAEVGRQERESAEVQARRMRRLGLQGMVGGTAFGLFFGLSAVLQGGTAWWHLFPASFAAAIGLYGMYMYARAGTLLPGLRASLRPGGRK